MTGEVVYLSENSSEQFGYIKAGNGNHVLLGRNLRGYRRENMHKLVLVEGSIVSFEDHEGMAKEIVVEKSPGKIILVWRVTAGPLVAAFILGACAFSILPAKNLLAYLSSAILALYTLLMCRETFGKIRDILS